MYPADVKPPIVDGINWIKATIASRGTWDQRRCSIPGLQQVADGTEKQNRFIADDRAVANIILGEAVKLRRRRIPTKGTSTPMRRVLDHPQGQMNYRIEVRPKSLPMRVMSFTRRAATGTARASMALANPAASR